MSFWELVVVGIVALLVLGPEKLPGAIRTVTGTIRSIREFGHQMKSELSDELRVHELHEKLRQAEEKGLLGLSVDEINALAELRQAAADVNNPYSPNPAVPALPDAITTHSTPATQTTSAATPAQAAPVTASVVTTTSPNNTAQVNEQKTPT